MWVRLVCGLRNEAIQKWLYVEANVDLKKTFDIVVSIETATQRAVEL